MGNLCVGGDDQIEIAHDRCGIDERIRSAVEFIAQRFHRGAGGEVHQLIQAVVLLQTDQAHARQPA